MAEEIDWRKLGLASEEELNQINMKHKKIQEDGIKDILKYFDRIHDKLFTFNNILRLSSKKHIV